MASSMIPDSFHDTVNCAWREVHKMEMAAIEDILCHHIENPIEGELTREKVKRAGVRCLVYDEAMNGDFAADTKWEDGNLYVEVQSAFLGIAQGDWLIGPHGIRRRLTEKEEAYLSKLELEEWMEEMGFKQENINEQSYNIMTKNDFKKLVPDVMCQDLVVTTDNPATLGDKARNVADMMETGLIAYDYTAASKGYRLKVFTSYAFKAFLNALKPGAKVTNARGREFTIESYPYIANLRMCVRANGDTWFCDTIYDKDKEY